MTGNVKRKTEIAKPDGLVGRCFVIWGDNKKWSMQGYVVARLDDEHYLVRFFEAALGYPSTMAIYSVSQLTAPAAPFERMNGAFEFFEDDEHLREWTGMRS